MTGARTRLLVLVALAAAAVPPVETRKVDVGEHRLHAIRKGQGSPVVVFDAGMGDSLEVWHAVWPAVAKRAGVLLYDRAGLGKSDPGPLPRTSEQIVAELVALLDAYGIREPVVLVGHSFGGMNARLFAALHPERVAGLVLIDPTPVDFPAREGSLRGEAARRKIETELLLAEAGQLREREVVAESAEQLRRARPLPSDLPVAVLSSASRGEPAPFPDAWRELQAALAIEVGADLHVVTEVCGHYIQYDAPELVVETILDVVDEVRERDGTTPGSLSDAPRRAPSPPPTRTPDRP